MELRVVKIELDLSSVLHTQLDIPSSFGLVYASLDWKALTNME